MAQKLILFEDILNGAAIKSNKTLMAELGKLAEYVFGESGFSIEKAEKKADDIQIWSGDELYKALANDYGTAFRFKSAFVIEADGYVGPVMAWFFEPDGAFDDQIVVLTCESNGLFKNPRYVCGLLISEYDLDRLLGEFGDDHDDDEDDEDWDEDEEDKEEINDDKLKSSVLQAISEIKEKEEATDKGDLILKLVSYEGSIIKMMTVLSCIEGIDEEAAFNILQKLLSIQKDMGMTFQVIDDLFLKFPVKNSNGKHHRQAHTQHSDQYHSGINLPFQLNLLPPGHQSSFL